MTDLAGFQASFEQRFGCCICLGPKLNMVSGQCQHRICDECLYENFTRRACMENCPVCGFCDSFPRQKPIIPTQVIEVQKYLGIQQCTAGCSAQIWWWEKEEHARSCPMEQKQQSVIPKTKSKTERKKRHHVTDLSVVSVSNRLARQDTKNMRKLRSMSMRQNGRP